MAPCQTQVAVAETSGLIVSDYQEHSERMYAEEGYGLTPGQHKVVYAYAWREGHWAGLDEVKNHYLELADVARKIINIVNSE